LGAQRNEPTERAALLVRGWRDRAPPRPPSQIVEAPAPLLPERVVRGRAFIERTPAYPLLMATGFPY